MAKKKNLVPMINWVYDLILWVMSVLVDLFFREVHPRGSWKVPRRGPVIFVAAPHANQVSRLNTAIYLLALTTAVRRSSYPDAGDQNGSWPPHSLAHR